MAWTEDRIETLRTLWDKGLSASQIAKELGEGVTRNAVIGKAHRLSLKSRPSPVKTDKDKKKVAPKRAAKKADKTLISLLDLTDRMCKWPLGHPGDDDFHFCGKPSENGMPYCAGHCAEAYQAQPPRRDRRPQQQRRPIG
ncbi:MAG: global cell cycle regulator GcrA-like protein [Kordiimonadales bacterium]|nr:MAG: global cell cycle regulator GcrA-like protein [Kordiimonadales bacterium]